MTDRERAENIAKNIDTMAEEIAKRSIPSSDESFREWSIASMSASRPTPTV
jgi:hypothetical protein